MTTLEQAVTSVTRFLDERGIPYMLIGGIANLVWGQPRATLDVDASVLVDESKWPDLIKELSSVFRIVPKHPLAFLRKTHVLPLDTLDGVRIDLIWAQLPYEHKAIARATVEQVLGARVRVCQPEDLIILKIASERLKDREDVRAIIQQQAGRLDRRYLAQAVRQLAHALGQPELLDFLNACLHTSRLPRRSRK